MTIPDGIRKLLNIYDRNENRLMLTMEIVDDATFISEYGNEPFALIHIKVPESINEMLEKEASNG